MFIELYFGTNTMEAPGFASPIRAYRQNLSKMRESNDPSDSEVKECCLVPALANLDYCSRIITLERTVFMMLWWKT